MNKFKKAVLNKLAAVGRFAAIKAAGSASYAGYHQPKEPQALKKNLKK